MGERVPLELGSQCSGRNVWWFDLIDWKALLKELLGDVPVLLWFSCLVIVVFWFWVGNLLLGVVVGRHSGDYGLDDDNMDL